MRKETKDLDGLKIIDYSFFQDDRGALKKIFRQEIFTDLFGNIEEIYISTSHANVVRGLHFQVGAHAQDKFIFCVSGKMLDISVDLNPGSSFGKLHVVELNSQLPRAVFVPGSFAHGVITLQDNTSFMNISPQRYSPGAERGINWKSLGLKIHLSHPIVSEKDEKLPPLSIALKELEAS